MSFVDNACVFALLEHLGNQIVREDKLGFGQEIEGQPDDDRLAVVFDLDKDFAVFGALQDTLEPLAPTDELTGFDLGEPAGPRIKVFEAGEGRSMPGLDTSNVYSPSIGSSTSKVAPSAVLISDRSSTSIPPSGFSAMI